MHGHEETSSLARAKAYIDNVLQALEQLRSKELPGNVKKLIELAELYAKDAQYYLDKGDVITSIAAIAYAEGLLDALRWLEIVDFEWHPLSRLLERPKVVVAGTFDILHPGHISLFKEAWKKGRVYVIIARDSNVKRFKGREPIIPEKQRAEVIAAIKYVSEVILGSERDILEPIVKIKPDIIFLGPDQWANEDWLRKSLEERGVSAKIVRLKEREECPLCSTTEIACRIIDTFPRSQCSKNLTSHQAKN
ncbi:MAG: DUF357 domain-containing protein [Pyrodictiaceae archaeon]